MKGRTLFQKVWEAHVVRPETVDAPAVLRPRDSEALLDEHAFEDEEFLPYWAELWPSGVAAPTPVMTTGHFRMVVFAMY